MLELVAAKNSLWIGAALVTVAALICSGLANTQVSNLGSGDDPKHINKTN
jgi:hypothetical protein